MSNNTDVKFTDKELDNFLAKVDAVIELSVKEGAFSCKLSGNMLEFGTLLFLACENNETFKDILITTASYYNKK